MFQAMQSVKVDNPKLDQHGQAGYVTDDDGGDKVTVKMDIENEEFVFDRPDLKAL
jgi:hypothetical protein